MRRIVIFVVIAIAAFIALVVALWEYSYSHDQANFKAAKNKCEVGCIQDSGGIESCRKVCADHPGHYP